MHQSLRNLRVTSTQLWSLLLSSGEGLVEFGYGYFAGLKVHPCDLFLSSELFLHLHYVLIANDSLVLSFFIFTAWEIEHIYHMLILQLLDNQSLIACVNLGHLQNIADDVLAITLLKLQLEQACLHILRHSFQPQPYQSFIFHKLLTLMDVYLICQRSG